MSLSKRTLLWHIIWYSIFIKLFIGADLVTFLKKSSTQKTAAVFLFLLLSAILVFLHTKTYPQISEVNISTYRALIIGASLLSLVLVILLFCATKVENRILLIEAALIINFICSPAAVIFFLSSNADFPIWMPYASLIGKALISNLFYQYHLKESLSINQKKNTIVFIAVSCIFLVLSSIIFMLNPNFVAVPMYGLFLYNFVLRLKRDSVSLLIAWASFCLGSLVVIEMGVFIQGEAGVLVISALYLVCYVLLLIACIITIRNVYIKSLEVLHIENEIAEMQKTVLHSQIKSHFVFNVLTSIEALYSTDKEAGDAALQKLSKHLRLVTKQDNSEMIAFSTELDNMKNYYALECLYFQNDIPLIYNIKFSDFYVPQLSLQPLIENCLKHADLKKEEGGRIVISAEKKDGKITLSVSDNGKGFDSNKVKKTSVGLSNVKQRMKYVLDAQMEIISSKGSGTEIKISFKQKRGVMHE